MYGPRKRIAQYHVGVTVFYTTVEDQAYKSFCDLVNLSVLFALLGTQCPQRGTMYSSIMIGTLGIDGWIVTFGTAINALLVSEVV